MADPLGEARLAEIEALAAAASPGPWAVTSWDLKGVMPLLWAADALPTDQRGPFAHITANDSRDAAFIAAARAAVPEMLAEVRRQAGQIAQRDILIEVVEAFGRRRDPIDPAAIRRAMDAQRSWLALDPS